MPPRMRRRLDAAGAWDARSYGRRAEDKRARATMRRATARRAAAGADQRHGAAARASRRTLREAPAAPSLGAVNQLRKQSGHSANRVAGSEQPVAGDRGGAIERSEDGGRIWIPVRLAGNEEVLAGASPGRLVAWLVGRSGLVLLATDGTNFTRLPFPESVDLVAVSSPEPRIATVTTADGRTFRRRGRRRQKRRPYRASLQESRSLPVLRKRANDGPVFQERFHVRTHVSRNLCRRWQRLPAAARCSARRCEAGPAPIDEAPIGEGQDLTTTLDDQAELSITVYNSDIALVRDVRNLQLARGTGNLRFMDIAATVNPATVHFRSLTEPSQVSVLEQNYEYDLLEPDKLLRKYVGREVTLMRNRQEGGTTRQEEVKALLLSYNTQPVWKIGNEIVTGIGADHIRFPELPETLYSRPTLIWTVQNDGAAKHRVEASYLAAQPGVERRLRADRRRATTRPPISTAGSRSPTTAAPRSGTRSCSWWPAI